MPVPPAFLNLLVGDNVFQSVDQILAQTFDSTTNDFFNLDSVFFGEGSFEHIEGSLIFQFFLILLIFNYRFSSPLAILLEQHLVVIVSLSQLTSLPLKKGPLI